MTNGKMSNMYLIKKNPYFKGLFLYLILFLIAFCFLLFLQPEAKLADPDSFYHAKMAMLIKEQGIFKSFPWLQFSVIRDNYADHHFLYHVLLIPLVSFFHPLWATKLLAVFLASSLIVLIYYFLRNLKVRGAFWYSLFLLTISPFVFRISLAKAPVLSIMVLLLAWLALIKKKPVWLFILSFAYVWLYGGWPLMGVLVFIYCLIEGLKTKKVFKAKNWQNLGIAILGLLSGLIINPYFPENLKFYWYQTFQVGLLNYASEITVGTEWYPYALSNLFADTVFLSLFFLLALSFFVISIKKQNTTTWSALLFSLLFLVLTLKSRRNAEYLVPFVLIFSATQANIYLRIEGLKKIKRQAREVFANHIFWLYIVVFLGVIFVAIFCADTKRIRSHFRAGFAFDKWQGASDYLETNSKPGGVVFHSDWDEFPILFYHNSRSYYITGLDATFMYLHNQDLYQKYVDITKGEPASPASSADGSADGQKMDLYSIIKEEFSAEYVFIDDSHKEMRENIEASHGFERVYEGGGSWVYKVL